MLPGSTVVQIVGYLGWRLGGWSGSAAATIGFVAPAFFVMLALSALYLQVSGLPGIQGALRGLNAAFIGLLVITAYNLGRSAINLAGLVVLINTAHNGGRLVHEFGVRAIMSGNNGGNAPPQTNVKTRKEDDDDDK